MRSALAEARLRPEQIDHVNAHGTATPDNDTSEYRAMERVFGAHLRHIPVTAAKSALGHALGGAGGVEAILTLLAIRSNLAPATLHTRCVDPAMPDLDLVTERPRAHPIHHAMTNSFGFGGANASLILGACDG
jgi:3-oxoacyl-[acyl-carrier-protein] synthase II